MASAVKWLQLYWYQQRSAAPKPRGGGVFAVGRVRGRDFGSDRPTAGPDPGRNGCRTAQTTDQNQPQLALAFFSTDTTSRSKKVLRKQPNSGEQMWRERAAAGYESKVCLILPGWCLSTRPPSARTWSETERASPAWRPGDWRRSAWKMETITFVAALRHNKMVAPMVVEGAMTGEMLLRLCRKLLGSDAPTQRHRRDG